MNSPIPAWRFTVILAMGLLTFAHRGAADTRVERIPFGSANGHGVDLFVLTDARGMVAKVMTYGATHTALDVPDRDGKPDDVVLGFDSITGYLQKEPYFGAVVGRVGNRIAKGRFTLDGETYQLETNNGPNHLHGGIKGFDKVIWDAKVIRDAGGSAVEFRYLSRDGEEGYPGNCHVTVVYSLRNSALWIRYEVTTDKDTPVNVTNHSYFNLGGAENGGILDQVLTLYADSYTPVDATLIPTGEIRPVAGTPMDFRKPTRIGEHLKEAGGDPVGFDHNFVVNAADGRGPAGLTGAAHVATVYDPGSGRVMDAWSTEPGVQFYSGNFLDGTLTGKKGVVYRQYWGIALETQHFPDSVNHPNFPSYVLHAGDTYRSSTVYQFSTK
jgi:aldose 1-epimerase